MTYHLLSKNRIAVRESLDLWELTFFNDQTQSVIRIRAADDKTKPARLDNPMEVEANAVQGK